MSTGLPLHLELYHEIQTRILNADLRPGARLPAEPDLARAYGVSRVTAHRALQQLAVDGWITRRRGKGSFVTTRSAESSVFSIATPPNIVDTPPMRDNPTATPSLVKPSMIGFVMPDASEWYGLNLLASIITASNQAEVSLMVNYSFQSQDQEETAIRRMLDAGVQGLLIYPVNGEFYNQEILRLSLGGFPMVLVDRQLTKLPVPYVSTDNHAAAIALTEHLIMLGHHHIGFLSPDMGGTVTLEERFTGYLQALERHALTPEYSHREHLHLPTGAFLKGQDRGPIYEAIRSYVLDHPRLTAVVVTEYQYAMILADVCRSMRIAVPDDLSIACFDGMPYSTMNAFTHIQQDEHAIGQAAFHMLRSLMDGTADRTIASTTFPGQLVLGSSSGPPKPGGSNRYA